MCESDEFEESCEICESLRAKPFRNRNRRNRRKLSFMDLTENCQLITDNYSGGETLFRHAAIAAAAATFPVFFWKLETRNG